LFSIPYALQLRPSKEFKYESGKTKLVNLHLSHQNEHSIHFTVPGDHDLNVRSDKRFEESGTQERLLRLSGWLDISCEITIGCVNAVLSFLQRKRASSFLPGDDASENFLRVTAVEMFSIKGTMFISMDTLNSLQIIDTESHPNAQNQGPAALRGAKEGFSLYGLFQRLAKTPQGKYRLRTYFLRPCIDVEAINERLDAVSAFLLPENSEYLDNLISCLRSVKNIRTLLRYMRKGSGGPNRGSTSSVPLWSQLLHFVFNALRIQDIMKEMQAVENTAIYVKVTQKFDSTALATIGKSISDVIDMDESKLAQRAVVSRGVDEDLDEKKLQYDGLDSYLVEVAKYVKSKLPIEFQQMDVSPVDVGYYPRIGFVLQISEEFAETLESHVAAAGSPWQHVFTAQYGYPASYAMRY
jgi:DNA mismatch repair protein MSH5